MNVPRYNQFEKESLILRDYLATDRTDLAIDRTILSYVRTALTLLIAGLSFIKFFNIFILTVFGWIFVFITPILLCIGVWRALEMKKIVSNLKEKDEKELKIQDASLLQPEPSVQQA